MISKRKIALYLLILITLCVFEVFYLTPVARLITYLTLILSTLGHIYFFKVWKNISRSLKIWYGIFLSLMIISILTARVHNGQSLFSGFVANVNFYYIGSAILFYCVFKKFKIQHQEYFALLLKTGWLLLGIYFLMALFGIQFIHVSELTGNIVVVGVSKVSKVLINFIAIYWFSRFLTQSSYTYLFYSVLFFSINHLVDIQRFLLLTTFLVFLCGTIIARNKRNSFKVYLPVLLISTIGIGALLILQLESDTLTRYTEAFKIFVSNASLKEAGVAARFIEAQFALDNITDHPFLGNGNIRASEKTAIAGDMHFFLSDIGILGVIYAFGVIGLLVYMSQLLELWNYVKEKYNNHYQLCIILNLIWILAFTMLTGQSIFSAQMFMLLLVLYECIHLKYIPILIQND